MLPTGQPQYVEIFVTHVVEDGPLLKIYGQLDRSAAIFVEKVILQYSEQFELGVGSVFPGSILVNTICCAKYGGDGVYYRAKIVDVSNIQQGLVRVNFIDYGNSDIVNISNIRSLSSMQNSPLCSVLGQATEFILAGIVPPMGIAWDESTVEFIKEKLCYAEFRCAIVAQFSGKQLIKLYYNDVDFAEILVQKNHALHISLQSQQNMLQNFRQYGYVPPFNYSVPPPVSASYNSSTNANLLVKAAAITKQESGVISAPLLAVGSKHTIYISYVEDGPYLFAVQLKSTENILQNMTKTFSQFMLKPFSQSPIPGSACVTLLTHTKVLCRAVVTNLTENKCMVYCVDFGNTETVPFSQIYEVPPQFLNTKSLAMRFSLAGIQNSHFNDKAKAIFQQLVMGETLLLEVVEPEGPPLKQYGNIYLNGENIITTVKEKLISLEKPKTYPSLPAIQPGRIVNVTVSYVESINDFYVQYDANVKALNNIMRTMEDYCLNIAALMRPEELCLGMPVCAHFLADHQWYRAKIVSVSGNEITVYHVDYGSSDTVSIVNLRHMDPNLLQCQAQAVQCALSGFQDYPGSLDDASNRLEELTLERKLTMKIISHLPNGKLLVELHDTSAAPVQNIAELIKKPARDAYETPIDEWRDPAAAGEPAIVQSHQFGSRDKSKFEDGSGEGWRSDAKKTGGWNEPRVGIKKWGNRTDKFSGGFRDSGDKVDQGVEDNKWGKDKSATNEDNWDGEEDSSKKFDGGNRTGYEKTWNNRGERGFNKDGNDWKNKDNRRGFDRESDNSRQGFNKETDEWQENENKIGFSTDGDNRRDNRRGFNRGGDDWKERDKQGFNKDRVDWKDKDNRRGGFSRDGDDNKRRGFSRDGDDNKHGGFSREGDDNKRGGFSRDGDDNRRGGFSRDRDDNRRGGFSRDRDDNRRGGFNRDGDDSRRGGFNRGGDDNRRSGFNRDGDDSRRGGFNDWKDREGGKQGFREGDNRRSRDGGDRNWKKNEDGNQEGKKWWGHDDRSEPEKKWNDRQDGDQRRGAREKRTGSAGEFKKWNDGGSQRGGGGGSSWKEPGEEVWGSGDSVPAATTVDSWDTSESGGDTKKPYPEPIVSLGSKQNVTLVSAEDPTNFVLQIDEKIPDVTKIMEEIAEKYQSGGNVVPETEQLASLACIARYPEDEAWYRAVITKPPCNNNTEVHFVDYGNRMDVPSDDVKEIKDEFKNIAPFGIPCSLFAVQVPVTEWTQEQIDEFLNLTDGKKLEAQFIENTGSVFNVILRDLEDIMSSLNEKFGASKESLDAGAMKKVEQIKVPISQIPSSKSVESHLEYAAPEDTFSIVDIGADASESVSVDWFINPDQFYCQRNGSKVEFTSMINDIQSAYKKRPACKGDLKDGQAVIAQFPADKVLYRAEIIEKSGLMYKVQYVDYGNMELLAPSFIWPIEKRFLTLPKQGILCALRGVQPLESEWPKDSPEFEKYFGVENIECTFHELSDGKYFVSLAVNGQDVAQDLVSCGLASEKVQEKVQPKEPLALHLLKGQQISAHVTFIESVSKFFVQLDPVSAKSIQENVEKHMESAKNSSPPSDLVEHQMCLATPDEKSWYRGKIIDIVGSEEVCINFVDFGDIHTVSLNQVRLLPDSLLGYRPQATECMVVGSDVCEGKIDEETFKSEVEAQDVIIYVEEIKNERLVVHLFDIEGQCLELLRTVDSSSPAEVQSLCPLPILTNTVSMWVSVTDNANTLWLQKESEADILSGLLELLFSFYEEEAKGVDLENPLEGQLSAVKSKDGSWYRARITSIAEEEITVLYIDYGNTEAVARSEVKELDASFCRIHALAVCASLPVIIEDPESCCKELENATTETVFDVSFAKSEDGAWFVNLENNTMNLVDLLLNSGVVSAIPSDLFRSSNAIIPSGEKIDVYLSHFESPSNFWIQKDSNFVDILDLQLNLQIVASDQSILSNAALGSLCIAQFTDEQWYRAKVVEINETIAKVLFLDYGNTYEVDVQSLRKLPVKFFCWPYFAVQCCLSDASFFNTEELVEKCSIVMSETETVFQLEKVGDGGPVSVSLYIGEKDLKDVVREREVTKEENVTVAEEPGISENSLVYVSHICSPAKFWIQDANIASELEKLCLVGNLEDHEVVANPEVGAVYAAFFEDDDLWYRAKVLELCNGNFHVLFIDYGRCSFVSELRQLSEDVLSVPPLAKCCRLQFPSGVQSWSMDADRKFVEMSGEGDVEFQWELCSKGEPQEVKLFQDGKNVSDLIAAQSCPPVLSSNTEGASVRISYINSLSSFWIQWASESSKLDSITDELLNADTFESLEEVSNDVVCAAQFSDDELWYRAKITSVENETIEVSFIDYGNSASVTKIHKLPEELVSCPPLAVHCSLPLPHGWKCWPEKAEEEFFGIFGDGTNTFVLDMLQEGDPSVVSLKLNNALVEEMLQKSCTGKLIEESSSSELSCKTSSTDVEILAETEVMEEPSELLAECSTSCSALFKHLAHDSKESFNSEEKMEENEAPPVSGTCAEEKLELIHHSEEPNVSNGVSAAVETSETVETLEPSEELDNDERPAKQIIEHKEQIIRDLKIELQMPSEDDTCAKKLGHAERIVPGSICRGISESQESEEKRIEETDFAESSSGDLLAHSESYTVKEDDVNDSLESASNGAQNEPGKVELLTEDLQIELSAACGESTPLAGSPKKTEDSGNIKEFHDTESLSISESSTINSSSNASQISADVSGSLDDSCSSDSTIVDSDGHVNTGCIDMNEVKSDYEIANLHKSEELYESSKSETKSSNIAVEVNEILESIKD